MRALRLLVEGIALFCLGISFSFLASAATTTEVCCAPAGKALGDADGEALVRLDEDPTSVPLTTTTPGEEAREAEELSVRASVLMSMLVVAASSFFSTSGLVLVARNSSFSKGVAHHPLGVLGGSSAAAGGRASLLGVFLL
jgi:hypothetical protein